MIVLGLILLILAIAVVAIMVLGGGDTVTIGWDTIRLNWEPSALMVFLAGAATLLLLVIAFACLRSGMARSRAKRQELRRLRKLDSANPQPQSAPAAQPRAGKASASASTASSQASTSTAGPTSGYSPSGQDAGDSLSKNGPGAYGPSDLDR
ncbi:MAG: hypothetical protein ACK5MT_02660 [Actinomycetales bacterium]